jgi:hypothetical protein
MLGTAIIGHMRYLEGFVCSMIQSYPKRQRVCEFTANPSDLGVLLRNLLGKAMHRRFEDLLPECMMMSLWEIKQWDEPNFERSHLFAQKSAGDTVHMLVPSQSVTERSG